MSNSLITAGDSQVINNLAIAGASLGLGICLVLFLTITINAVRNPAIVKANFQNVPSRLLYFALLNSVAYSVSYIITCSELGQNPTSCRVSMLFFISCIHVMTGLSASILLHCGLLLSSKNLKMSTLIVRLSTVLNVLFATALGTAGYVAGRYGWIEDQQTCWILPIPHSSSRYSAYKMEAILLYGPLYGTLLLNYIAILYVFLQLKRMKRSKTVGLTVTKSLVIRLAFPPTLLSIHCLMIIGGDLPITYHSRAAQFTSYLFNYVGLGTFGLALGLCALFVDPVFRNILRKKGSSQQSSHEEHSHQVEISVQQTQKNLALDSPIDEPSAEELQLYDSTNKELHVTNIETRSSDNSYDENNESRPVVDESAPKDALFNGFTLIGDTTARNHDSAQTNHHKQTNIDESVITNNSPRRPSVREGSVVKWPSDLSRRVSANHVCTPDGDCCIFIV